MRQIVFFFILQLNLEPVDVRKVLLNFPQVVDYNLESHLRPIAEFFTMDIKFSAAEFGGIVLKFPRLFSYSLFKVKHVTGYLRYELGLDARQTKRVLFQAPQVLGLSELKLKQKLDFLRSRLGLDQEELNAIFSKMPTVACVGTDNVSCKLDYMEKILKEEKSPSSLRDVVLKQPTLLGYSHECRIVPRMQMLVKNGVDPAKISVCISMSESNFVKWLNSSTSRLLAKDVNRSAWVKELGAELQISDSEEELEDVLANHPSLAVPSQQQRSRQRLRKLRSSGLSLRENLEALGYTDEKFSHLIDSSLLRSFLNEEMKMNSTATEEVLVLVLQFGVDPGKKSFRNRIRSLRDGVDSIDALVQILIQYPEVLSESRTEFDSFLATVLFQYELDSKLGMCREVQWLGITPAELQRLLPRAPWARREFRLRILDTLDCILSSQTNSDSTAAGWHLIREQPRLLLVPLSKLVTRFELMRETECDVSVISDVAFMPMADAKQFCTIHYLEHQLGFTPGELRKVSAASLDTIVSIARSLESISPKDTVRSMLLETPSLLTKGNSRKICQRVRLLCHLDSVGLPYKPGNLSDFLLQPHQAFVKELMPTALAWIAINSNEDDLMLDDFPRSIPYVSFQEENRALSRVVYWD